MPADRARLGRAILAVAAIYVAFLLCAQFGFLAQLEQRLGPSSAALRAVLAAMGLGGLGGSALAAVGRSRLGVAGSVRAGLLAVAAATASSTLAGGPLGLGLAAAALGGALGFATVALAGALRQLVPAGRWGAAAGWGTGAAYLVSNLPPLFAGPPSVRALVPAALCLVAAALPPTAVAAPVATPIERISRLRFGGWITAFAALVLVDSAAFAHVQATPALLAVSWGGAANQIRQGIVHFFAAGVAAGLLDRGRLRSIVVASAAIFALAIPALGSGGAGPAIAYATGISLYSAALVAAPAIAGRGAAGAALLCGLAGWIGSAAGVGAAKEGRLGAAAAIAALGLLGFAAIELAAGRRLRAALAPALALGVAAGWVARLAEPPARPADGDRVAAGRRVYLAEGCQHCHSQYVRPQPFDRLVWGPQRELDRSERPPTPGNRRIGPDLANAGLRRSELWHELHLRDPRALVPGSRMPSYEHLFGAADVRGPALVAYLASLGAAHENERQRAIRSWRPSAPVVGDATRGARLFARRCAACHGAGGRGDGEAARTFARPTMDLAKGSFHRVLPATAGEPLEVSLARTIRFGLPPGTMPGFEWANDSEIADLTAFVLRLSRSVTAGRGGSAPPPG